MILKSLEIQGFKSFADKTVLTFGQGITAVVGPNGSGKSNISDAVRWVLGEQSSKTLRGAKMEDVIFNGTANRRAVGFAEVSLTIDNRDRVLDFEADDVKVTRRYYRSGESEYLLNNATVRLRDVQLLFMDTGLGRDGYSLIGQGRIDDLVSSRSEDRREIFEEAAGIARYRYRKNEAERRLSSAEENLVRLRDIVRELEERVGPLKTQAEKARRYVTLASEKKNLEIGVWLHTLDRARETLRGLDSRLELARTQYDTAGRSQDEAEQELESLAASVREAAAELEALRAEAGRCEEEAVRCDGSADLVRNDQAHNEESIARLKSESEQAVAGREQLEQTVREREAEIAAREESIAEEERQQAALAAQWEALLQSSDAASGQRETLNRQAAALAAELSDVRVRAATNESSLAEIAGRLGPLREALAEHVRQGESLQRERQACEADTRQLTERITELQNAVRGQEMRREARKKRLEAARTEADRLALDVEERQRRIRLLTEMERSLEGFSHSVKAVAKQAERGALRGIRGPVSRLLHTEAAYALAVETALGGAAQHLVCEREEDAKRGIAFLKETKGGRATFLPLASVKGSLLSEKGLEQEPGFVGLAAELVQAGEDYTPVVRYLLGRVAVAEDLDAAVAIARRYGYRFRVVTLDGQVVNAGGSLSGGSHVREAGLLSRRSEIERLEQERKTLAAQEQQARDGLHTLQQELAAVEAELSGTQGELTTAQEDRIRLEGEGTRLAGLAAAAQAAQAAAEEEREALNRRAEECRRQVAACADATTAAEEKQREIERALTALEGGRQQLADQREQLTARMSEHKLAVVGYRTEIEGFRAAIEELRTRQTGQDDRRRQLTEAIAEREAQRTALAERESGLREEAERLRQEAAAAREQMEAASARRLAEETRQTALRQRSREAAEERERIGREVVRLEEQCAAAQRETDETLRRLFEEYELTRHEAEQQAAVIDDIAAATRRLAELKNKIRALGSVNVDAIEEYREVSERYEFLSGQVRDVEVSREELLRLIGDLTVQMRDMFLARFRQINAHFGEVFRDLFGGGKAELVLTDPDDVLHTGIELHAQPPGKVILNMAALSGGEKALVATALLFAILKVTPSPFCILDEVEAALDDVNVDRYAQYLRRMCDKTQFIVITHRRGTMEEADVLYGVTMQEQGISKLLALRASEVEAKLGITGNAP